MNTTKATNRKRQEFIGIAVSKDEKGAIEKAADLRGLTVSAYCRWVIIQHALNQSQKAEIN